MVTFTPAKLVLDRLAISFKWVVTPLGLQLSAIRSSEPEHTGSRIRIRTAVQWGFGFRPLFVGLEFTSAYRLIGAYLYSILLPFLKALSLVDYLLTKWLKPPSRWGTDVELTGFPVKVCKAHSLWSFANREGSILP